MTEQDFLHLVTTRDARSVLDALAAIPAAERRAFAKPARTLFRTLDRSWGPPDPQAAPAVRDREAVTIAVLATATASELKRMSHFPRPGTVALRDIVARLRPDWVQDVVDHFVELRSFHVPLFRPLWQAGLCDRPTSDAIILDYYSYMATARGFDEDALLGGDVWRFFEVEGGGEDSLANHDKYLKQGQQSWAEKLKRYALDGKLDRQRLLDASLDALARDFGQYRAGWYSRFHVLMAPDAAEMAARADRYLALLGASVPPTVSFALRHVQALDKAGALAPRPLLAALEPALQARAKATVTGALTLLRRLLKRHPELRAEVASRAVLALLSEAAAVQALALDIIEASGPDAVAADLAPHVAHVAPSLRDRIAGLARTGTGTLPEPLAPAPPAPSPTAGQPVQPVRSASEALQLFLAVLEDPRDPIRVERAIDGISRYGTALRADATALSPLRKRARQLCDRPGGARIRTVLALTGRALAEGLDRDDAFAGLTGDQGSRRPPPDLQGVHLARNAAVLSRLRAGQTLPVLSLPSDGSGRIAATDLTERMAQYRAAGVAPDPVDLSLAFLRLSHDAGPPPPPSSGSEAERALAYALGAAGPVGPTPELWAAAWRARQSDATDAAVVALFPRPMPWCGAPARMDLALRVRHSDCGQYRWLVVDVPVRPMTDGTCHALPALFGRQVRHQYEGHCCGHGFADIAWASLACPSDPEPFFRIGLIHQDVWQKLSDNPTRAFLEPFFRPGPPVGPLGAALLAYYMACDDKSVSSLATEATALLALDGRLSSDRFTAALKPFLLSDALPTNRWTSALKTVADHGAGPFARTVIAGVLDFAPQDTPRNIGGLIELCYELHVAQNALPEDPATLACLRAITGGGKAARFGRKLLQMSGQG